MAIPLAPVAALAIRAAAKNWRFWLGTSVFIGATTVSISVLLQQMASSALRLWPIIALAGFFILLRELIKEYFSIRREEAIRRQLK